MKLHQVLFKTKQILRQTKLSKCFKQLLELPVGQICFSEQFKKVKGQSRPLIRKRRHII